MEKLAFIYLLPIFICVFCGLAVFLIGRKYSVNQWMAYAYFFAAVGMTFVHSYELPVTEWSWFFDLVCTCATLSAYPAFYMYIRGLTSISGIRKKDCLIWLVPAIVAIGTIFCDVTMLVNGGVQQTIYYLNCVNGGGYIPQGSPWVFYVKRAIGSYCFRLAAFGEAVFLVSYAFYNMRNFAKVMHEYYTTIDEKTRASQTAITASLVTICIGTALYASHAYADTLTYKIIIISATLLIAVASLMMLYHTLSHKYSIRELQDLIAEAERIEKEESNNVVLTGAMDRMRRDIADLIEKKFFLDSSLTLISLAQMLGSNRTYVSNFIHTEYELSFSDFINKMRVEYAIQKMKENGTSLTTQELIEEVGFSSMPSFYRNFKKFTGSSPAKYDLRD